MSAVYSGACSVTATASADGSGRTNLDPVTQGTLGSALAQSTADRRQIRAFAFAGAVAGLSPDLDILIRSSNDPLLYLEFHRQFTHSLIFIPAGAGLCALLLHGFLRKWLSLRETMLACLLGYATHALLDACTSYGTQLFWPFSDYRVAWNWISVVDPLFSVPLFVMVILGVVKKRRVFALVGLCWAIAYMAAGAVQHHRAVDMARALATERGHDPVRVAAKPGFANLLVWKSVYEADGHFYVDGIRAGRSAMVCEGDRTAALDRGRDLPWLEPSSQQAKDLDRFGWYSNGWLAMDMKDPLYVVDVRYSTLPNRIDALWGLKLDPDAPTDEHTAWHVVEARRTHDLDQLFGLLAGRDCRPLRS